MHASATAAHEQLESEHAAAIESLRRDFTACQAEIEAQHAMEMTRQAEVLKETSAEAVGTERQRLVATIEQQRTEMSMDHGRQQEELRMQHARGVRRALAGAAATSVVTAAVSDISTALQHENAITQAVSSERQRLIALMEQQKTDMATAYSKQQYELGVQHAHELFATREQNTAAIDSLQTALSIKPRPRGDAASVVPKRPFHGFQVRSHDLPDRTLVSRLDVEEMTIVARLPTLTAEI